MMYNWKTIILIVILNSFKSFAQSGGTLLNNDDLYFGQKPPGMVPEIFAPGFISTEKRELNSVYSPGGTEFYYSIVIPGKGSRIFFTEYGEYGWSQPQLVSFSGEYPDMDMFITKDGERMYFASLRPINGVEQNDFKIWYVDRIGGEWGKPEYLNSLLNHIERSLYPTVSDNGKIYFSGIRDDCFGVWDIYYSELKNKKYSEPIQLGKEINSEFGEGDALIAPDESFIIICIVGRPDSYGDGDLYISFKCADGTWSELKNMGTPINSLEADYCPTLSPDHKYFFFTSQRSGNGDIYWVDSRIIEK